MKITIIFTAILLISSISNAQVNTLYEGDSSIVKGIITETGGYLLKNYDNDCYWSRLGDYYVNYDDSLNILNTINLSNYYVIKYDNKLFNFAPSYHIEGDTIEDLIINPFAVIDSIFLNSYDLDRGSFNSVKIPINNVRSAFSFTFCKEEEVFAIISAELYTRGIGLDDSNLCLTLIDTTGNVLNHIVYDKKILGFDILEQENKILINTSPSKMYYIDKSTWKIIDSINMHKYLFMSSINDSIFIGASGDYLYRQNTVLKTLDSISYRRSNIIPSHNLISGSPTINDYCFAVKNIDTIIYSYRVTDNTFTNQLGIAIDNININNLFFNERYVYNEFEPTEMKGVSGLIYTEDGGIILNIVTSNNPFASSNVYLLKFYPNGRLSLASVEPDKTAIILYPNPTTDFINIVSSDEIKEITIYNTLSQNVYFKKHKGKDIELNVSNFSKGNYIADIKTEKGNIRKKFIVE